MNSRRRFLSFLGAAPVAAVAAKAGIAAPVVEAAPPGPLKGELQFFVEQASYFDAHNHTATACHTHSFTDPNYSRTVLKVFDGSKWVAADSSEGVRVHNDILLGDFSTPRRSAGIRHSP